MNNFFIIMIDCKEKNIKKKLDQYHEFGKNYFKL